MRSLMPDIVLISCAYRFLKLLTITVDELVYVVISKEHGCKNESSFVVISGLYYFSILY